MATTHANRSLRRGTARRAMVLRLSVRRCRGSRNSEFLTLFSLPKQVCLGAAAAVACGCVGRRPTRRFAYHCRKLRLWTAGARCLKPARCAALTALAALALGRAAALVCRDAGSVALDEKTALAGAFVFRVRRAAGSPQPATARGFEAATEGAADRV